MNHLIIHWLQDTDYFFFLLLSFIIKILNNYCEEKAVRATETGSWREWKAADREHRPMKIPQFTQHDIVFYVIHRNLPAGDFTSFKSCTIYRASSKGVLAFAVAY